LVQLLNVNRQISLAADPYLPLFRSLRNAIIRERADRNVQAWLDPESALSDYYFREEGIRALDCIQASDVEIAVDQAEWSRCLEAVTTRAALTSAYLVPHLATLGGNTYAELFRRALQIIQTARRAQDRAWVGFNENWAIEFFAPLARSFPEARFLIVLRDPRAAISSNRLVPDPGRIAHAPSFARCWRKYVACTIHYQSHPLFAGRLCVLTYEELVRNPERIAKMLCEFLEVEYDPAMLDTDQYIDVSTGKTWQGNSNYEAVTSGISAHRIDRWRRYLQDDVVKTVEFICDPDMRVFGYAASRIEEAVPLDPDVLRFVLQENAAGRSWRSDFGEPEKDLGCELFRKILLASSAQEPDAGLIRRSFLFQEAFHRLRQASRGQAAGASPHLDGPSRPAGPRGGAQQRCGCGMSGHGADRSRMRPLTIIAEVAQGYEGKPLLGELLIKGAAEAGADAVKFQIVFADDVAVPGYQYYDWFRTLQMPEEAWGGLKMLAHQCGLKFYVDLSGEQALQVAKRLAPDAVKIHSGNFFNHRLVEQTLEMFPRVLVSTGGIYIEEIERFIQRHQLSRGKDQVVFLYGFQADPTPLECNALGRLPKFMERLDGFEVGFMDHVDGGAEETIAVSVMVQALGVRLFEKHITLDRALRLEDYASGLEPSRFAEYVKTLRRLDAALGTAALTLHEAELAYRKKTLKKLLLVRDLPAGHAMTAPDVVQKRQDIDGDGSFCYDPDVVIGKRLARPLAAGQPLREEDVLE